MEIHVGSEGGKKQQTMRGTSAHASSPSIVCKSNRRMKSCTQFMNKLICVNSHLCLAASCNYPFGPLGENMSFFMSFFGRPRPRSDCRERAI